MRQRFAESAEMYGPQIRQAGKTSRDRLKSRVGHPPHVVAPRMANARDAGKVALRSDFQVYLAQIRNQRQKHNLVACIQSANFSGIDHNHPRHQRQIQSTAPVYSFSLIYQALSIACLNCYVSINCIAKFAPPTDYASTCTTNIDTLQPGETSRTASCPQHAWRSQLFHRFVTVASQTCNTSAI